MARDRRVTKEKATASEPRPPELPVAEQHVATGDSALTLRLLEVLELKGLGIERLAKLDRKRPGIVARTTAFRAFRDEYLVDLYELPDDEEVGRPEWKEFLKRLEKSGLGRGVLVTNRSFNAAIVKIGRASCRERVWNCV